MPSVTGSPIDDEVLRSASAVVPLFRAPRQPCCLHRRLPIDSTCLRLKSPLLSPSPLAFFLLSLLMASPFIRAFLLALSRFRTLVSRFPPLSDRLPLSIAHPRVEKKSVLRFFRPLSFSRRPNGSCPRGVLDTARFRRVSIQRARSFF